MATIFITASKTTTLDHLKMRVFWNKGYEVIIFVYDVKSKILSHDWNYIVDVVMWPRFVATLAFLREKLS